MAKAKKKVAKKVTKKEEIQELKEELVEAREDVVEAKEELLEELEEDLAEEVDGIHKFIARRSIRCNGDRYKKGDSIILEDKKIIKALKETGAI